MTKPREEHAVFQDLETLCRRPGYVHAIAHFCFRDNLVLYEGELRPDDMEGLYGDKRLVRTEIATLIGLLVKQPIDVSLPDPEQMQGYIERTEALLHELHLALAGSWTANFKPGDDYDRILEGMRSAQGLREPIFYGGESAYGFQYRDLALEKYAPDEAWLLENKGFRIADAVAIAQALGPLQSENQIAALHAFREAGADAVTFLPGFILELDAVAAATGLDRALVETILEAFTLPGPPANATFDTLSAFNAANATPIIKLGEGRWLLLQFYTLLEALYEAPFFWMMADKGYRATHSAHRGAFAESFATARLERVFGKGRVIRNVDIWRGKDRVGEIDVLVMFGDRAIVLQAKSKRLTIEARKGNDLALQNDFKSAVQDAVDQALLCSECLLAPEGLVFMSDGAPVDMGGPFRGVYPLCVVSDHYPALASQARHFLKPREWSKAILTPLVIDVFALDAMTEMLERPLQLINYFSLRSMFGDKLMFTHELTLLGYHLQGNLWVENANDMLALSDDISINLDAAMTVRRDGLPGERTPDGILTRLRHTTIWRLVSQIETRPNPATTDLGLWFLQLSEKTALELSAGIDRIVAEAGRDGRPHDVSVVIGGTAGLCIHVNAIEPREAARKLQAHCELRKYSAKVDAWFGVLLSPGTGELVFSMKIEAPWEENPVMAKLTAQMPMGQPQAEFRKFAFRQPSSQGRNGPCACGSGKKYKKCCLG
jgi:hypothetical protein